MKKSSIIGLIIVGLAVCAVGVFLFVRQQSSFHFYVRLEEAGKLKTGDNVYHRGLTIGEITDINLKNSDIFATVALNSTDQFHPCANDKYFVIDDKMLMGSKCLRNRN